MLRFLVAFGLMCAPAQAFAYQAGQDTEFSELHYACYGEDAEDFAGTEGKEQACKDVKVELAKAKSEGLCWRNEDTTWVRCE